MSKPKTISPIGYLSYSNGASSLDPYKYRVVGVAGDQLSYVARAFSNVGAILTDSPVVILNYPSFLGYFEGITVVDTYLREATFAQATLLALAEERPLFLVGQPLSLVHLIRSYLKIGHRFPSRVVVALGGYFCPSSLERYIRELLAPHCSQPEIIFGYGIAEVEFACLIGKRDKEDQPIIYRRSSDSVEIKRDSTTGNLLLRRVGEESYIDSGDNVEISNANGVISLQIRQSKQRLPDSVLDFLESWTSEDWDRRTGYLGVVDSNIKAIQLRADATKIDETEEDFFDFKRSFKQDWADKPKWNSY